MNICELNALASNLDNKDDKVNFMTLIDELERLNGAIRLGNDMLATINESVNELREDRNRIANELTTYFKKK